MKTFYTELYINSKWVPLIDRVGSCVRGWVARGGFRVKCAVHDIPRRFHKYGVEGMTFPLGSSLLGDDDADIVVE